MSKSSEEVLLVVKHVRHKKSEGTLYMMGERMAWMLDSDSKDKVQLQVVMHDGSANTFQFANQKGRPAQQADRDSVKEILQQLLPQFKRKVSSELEMKNRLLQDDPELFQLYKDLVVSQVISAEEFWASRAHKFSNSTKNDNKQSTGVSPAFLADIKPQTDGANGLKYNLTADIIESIFKTYPMVKKKHAECVPHKLSEGEFWTRFFQSHYFHRDRININSKDIFSECAKHDEEEIRTEISQKVTNPFLNMAEIKDTAVEDEYRGIVDDNRVSTNITNQSLIRRFNHHSTMVLRACQSDPAAATSAGVNDISANGKADAQEVKGAASKIPIVENGRVTKSSSSSSRPAEPPQKKARLQAAMEMEDFKDEVTTGVGLRLEKMERYRHGPTPAAASRYTTSEDVVSAFHTVSEQMQTWHPDPYMVVNGQQALGVLGELSPGGALMQGTTQQQLHRIVSPEVQVEIKNIYNALCELLRHFWNCFPATTKFLEEKVVKMRGTLERFQTSKLQPLKDRLSQYHYTIDLTAHMEEILNSAFNKFDMWQARRISRKT